MQHNKRRREEVDRIDWIKRIIKGKKLLLFSPCLDVCQKFLDVGQGSGEDGEYHCLLNPLIVMDQDVAECRDPLIGWHFVMGQDIVLTQDPENIPIGVRRSESFVGDDVLASVHHGFHDDL